MIRLTLIAFSLALHSRGLAIGSIQAAGASRPGDEGRLILLAPPGDQDVHGVYTLFETASSDRGARWSATVSFEPFSSATKSRSWSIDGPLIDFDEFLPRAHVFLFMADGRVHAVRRRLDASAFEISDLDASESIVSIDPELTVLGVRGSQDGRAHLLCSDGKSLSGLVYSRGALSADEAVDFDARGEVIVSAGFVRGQAAADESAVAVITYSESRDEFGLTLSNADPASRIHVGKADLEEGLRRHWLSYSSQWRSAQLSATATDDGGVFVVAGFPKALGGLGVALVASSVDGQQLDVISFGRARAAIDGSGSLDRSNYGATVMCVGDLDRDTIPDFVVTAPFAPFSSYAYFGSGADGSHLCTYETSLASRVGSSGMRLVGGEVLLAPAPPTHPNLMCQLGLAVRLGVEPVGRTGRLRVTHRFIDLR
ncbi:MAG: hypothetical protein AAGA20_04955 [Planctomycetota bacterium]